MPVAGPVHRIKTGRSSTALPHRFRHDGFSCSSSDAEGSDNVPNTRRTRSIIQKTRLALTFRSVSQSTHSSGDIWAHLLPAFRSVAVTATRPTT
jgi:hypothetical protein